MAKKNLTLSMDKLIDCPCCNSNACYESQFKTQEGDITTWLCMTCGMTTNTSMEDGSEILEESFELTAEIIKDNKQVHDNLVWLLTVITMPDKGMIFPEPIKDNNDWKWTVVKAIPIIEEEKEKFPNPNQPGEFYKTKMDMKNLKRFGKLEFMDAAEELGMFGKLKTGKNED
jgi:transcription elongation factor Elf1